MRLKCVTVLTVLYLNYLVTQTSVRVSIGHTEIQSLYILSETEQIYLMDIGAQIWKSVKENFRWMIV